jgi:UDP-glucose:(heptosyl)LPS alpha-1,3-glucosyltransferase
MLECANYLARRGHDVTVYASEFEYDSLDSSIRTDLVHMPKSRFAAPLGLFARAVDQKIREQHFDLHCTFGVICSDGGFEWVQSVHKAWLEISQSSRDLGGRVKQWCNPTHAMLLKQERHRFGGKNYRRLLALTPRVKADLQRLYGVPECDIEIVPNGFSAGEFNVSNVSRYRENLRRELGYQSSDKVVIFVANELERKGFFPLARAIAMLRNPDLKLLIAGKVDAEQQRNFLGELGLTAATKFVGQSAEVQKYYAAADLFVLPTKYEAWGMVIVEAMACGLPAITSRLAGASVAVNDGINGFLLDRPTDPEEVATKIQQALYSLSTDPDKISASVSQFSWDNILAKYEDLALAQCAQFTSAKNRLALR